MAFMLLIELLFLNLAISPLMQRVVREMNRLGMMVDISHVNNYTMVDVLDTTLAPGKWGGGQCRLINFIGHV